MASDLRDDLLLAYQRELNYLRERGAEFASRYPKIAARLDLGPDQSTDPHVERLIESFAFLTARIQRQLESEFPQFTSSLLSVLYPHFQEPVPSMSIAHIEADPEQGLPLSGYPLPPFVRLFTQTESGTPCRFMTTYPVTLWPIRVTEAAIDTVDRYPFLDAHPKVLSVLRVRIETEGPEFKELTLDRLRFYLNGDGQTPYALYELLIGSALGVAVLKDGQSQGPIQPPSCIRPVGLEADEAVLQGPDHSLPEYRLLQEYFVFPEKFLFIDVDLPTAREASRSIDILFLLGEMPGRRMTIGTDTFLLGCTPIVNLFRKTSEPIRIDHRQHEYALIGDKREEDTTEIHSIVRVSSSADPGHPTTIEPFFSFRHPAESEHHRTFYYARRQPVVRRDLTGTEMYLSFVDLGFNISQPAQQTVYAHVLCTNRSLAAQIPAGAPLQIEEAAPLRSIVCLRKPTQQIDVPLGGRGLWLLISQLSINHLSLSDEPASLVGFQEILRLYRAAANASSENQIVGISRLSSRPALRQVGADAWRGFCQGLEITVEFDETLYVGNSALMMSSVLSRFFGLYASVNSFTELVVRSAQRQGVWKRWQPMAGAQRIL